MMGSMMTIPCSPPGELCALRGGVFVSTVTPRQRSRGPRESERGYGRSSCGGHYRLSEQIRESDPGGDSLIRAECLPILGVLSQLRLQICRHSTQAIVDWLHDGP